MSSTGGRHRGGNPCYGIEEKLERRGGDKGLLGAGGRGHSLGG